MNTYNLVLAFVFTFSTNVAFGSNIEYFESTSDRGYKGSCEYIENDENDLIREGYLKHILDAQSKAKAKCELNTGSLCAIVSWGGKNTEIGCCGEAKAVAIKN